MLPDAVLRVLPPAYLPPSSNSVTPLTGGSDRCFYRVRGKGSSWIVLHDTAIENEFARYLAVQERLIRAGVGVPEIHYSNADAQVAVLEDLGDTSLGLVTAHGTSPDTADVYRNVIDFLIGFQRAVPAPQDDAVLGDRAFGPTMLRWETWYFRTHYLGVLQGISEERTRCLLPEFVRLAETVNRAPRVLLHRDFQAQNVYMTDGRIRIIDFQAAQPGPAGYDAASLIHDPYVDLPEPLCRELEQAYRNASAAAGIRISDEIMLAVTLQRLLQALGAYGYLAAAKGKKTYLKHIPAALRQLQNVLDRYSGEYSAIRQLLCL